MAAETALEMVAMMVGLMADRWAEKMDVEMVGLRAEQMALSLAQMKVDLMADGLAEMMVCLRGELRAG